MRNEIYLDKTGKPITNNILVEVIDTFEGFTTKTGIRLVNATDNDSWGDSDKFNITEFIIRYGKVVRIPDKISSGTFDYDTELEVEIGDTVYWNSISFKEHTPLVVDDKKYLLADYHEVILRIRGNEVTPVNGFCLLLPIKETFKAMEFAYTTEKSSKWELYRKPEKLVTELNPRNYFDDIWEVGETVYIQLIDKPYKLEGYINRAMDKELYACPLRMIMCSEEKVTP